MRVNPVISTLPQADNQPYQSIKDNSGAKPTYSNQSKFESLEPSRYPTDEPNHTKNTRSTPKTLLNIYDKSETTHNRRNTDIDELREYSAMQIQKLMRGYLTRKQSKHAS